MSHQISRRTVFFGAAGLSTAALLAACTTGSSDGSNPAPGRTSNNNGIFTIGTGVAASNQFPGNFNRYGGGETAPGMDLVYEPLFRLSSTAGGQLIPVLAESAEHSEDGLTVTYKLRKDVTWSDGKPFTSRDVWFTLGTIYGKPNPNPPEGEWTWLRSDIEMPDEHTVVVPYRTDQRQQEVNLALYYPIVPSHVFQKGDALEFPQDTMSEPVGTGAYKLKRFASQLVEYEARDDYWGGKPEVKEIHFVPAGQAGNIETQITQGNIDFSEFSAPGVVTGFAKAADTNKYAWVADGSSRGIIFQCQDEARPTADVHVRKALRSAIDPESVREAAGIGYTIPNIVGVDPTLNKDLMKPEFQEPFKMDVDLAKKELEQSGWKINGNGNLEKDGKEHPLRVYVQNDAVMEMVTVPIVVAQWKQNLGLNVTFDPKPKDVMDVLLQEGDFDLANVGLNYPGSPWSNYTMYDQTVTKPGEKATNGNWGRWQMPEEGKKKMEILVSTLNTPETQDKIAEGVQGVQQAIFDEAPYAPLSGGGTGTMYTVLNWTGVPEQGAVDYFPRVGGQGNLIKLMLELKPA